MGAARSDEAGAFEAFGEPRHGNIILIGVGRVGAVWRGNETRRGEREAEALTREVLVLGRAALARLSREAVLQVRHPLGVGENVAERALVGRRVASSSIELEVREPRDVLQSARQPAYLLEHLLFLLLLLLLLLSKILLS